MVQRESLGDGKQHMRHLGLRNEEARRVIDNDIDVIIEPGTRIFNIENIKTGENVYIGHDCFIDGYHVGSGLDIGDNCWIGPGCYIHAAGGVKIGKNTGIGPHVKMLTSYHDMFQKGTPVIENEIKFEGIEIGEDCDIGMGVMLLPGAKIGRGCIVEAGAIVREDLSGCEIRIIKMKDGKADPSEVRRVI